MKEVNTSYYQQLLDKGRYNPSDRNFYQKVLDSIKKQGGKATDRQYNIIQQIKFGKTMYSSKNEHIYNKNKPMDQLNQLRQLIKESIQEYIREVEASGNIAAQEAKIRACEEAIALREKKANMEGLDEAYHDMMDSTKINEIKKEIKELQKYKSKAEKVLDKMKTKAEGKTTKKMEDEGMEDGTVDEVNLDEYTDDPASGPQLEENVDKEMYSEMAQQMKSDGMDYEETVEKLEDMGVDNRNAEIIAMNVFKEKMEEEMNIYEVLHMQKLAGILSETDYKAKVEEAEKKMTTTKKEDIVKSMKKSKSFGKSKDEKAKMYATATKLATKKKAKSLKEQVKALFENEGTRYFVVVNFKGQSDELGNMHGIEASDKNDFMQKFKSIFNDNISNYYTFYEVSNKEEMNKIEQMSDKWEGGEDTSETKYLQNIADKAKSFDEISF